MTDEQVWEDLSRFAQAMKRGATVVMGDGSTRPSEYQNGKGVGFCRIAECGGIREIIGPPQKGATAPEPRSICKKCGERHYGLAFILCCECQAEMQKKKARPLNKDELAAQAGCVLIGPYVYGCWFVPSVYASCWQEFAVDAAKVKATCHPPGNPGDVRPLFVEE